MTITALPSQPSKPNLKQISMLLYGAPKIGKSTFCSQIPNALFIDTEHGLSALSTFRVEVNSWMDILETLALLSKGKHGFKTLIIDTVDRAVKLCAEAVVDAYNKKNSEAKVSDVSEISFGKGYKQMESEFSRVVTKLYSLGMTVIFTSHEVVGMIDTASGTRTKIMPSLDERCRKVLLPLCDIIAHVQNEQMIGADGSAVTRRFLQVIPSNFYEAGDRTRCLKDGMPFSYEEFAKCMRASSINNNANQGEKTTSKKED